MSDKQPEPISLKHAAARLSLRVLDVNHVIEVAAPPAVIEHQLDEVEAALVKTREHLEAERQKMEAGLRQRMQLRAPTS